MADEAIDLTFLAWADTHFGYEQRFGTDDIRGSAVEQMNALPGWPWPAPIEGVVDEPAFVLHAGDVITSGPDADRKLRYYGHALRALRWPIYECLGNHDMSEPFIEYFVSRHGGTSYATAAGGVRLLSLLSLYDEKERGEVAEAQLRWLAAELEADPHTPTILLTHCRLDELKNGRQVLDVLPAGRVVLVVSGHKHRGEAFDLDGLACLSVGHCRNHPIDAEWARTFYVVRLRDNRIDAAAWRWDLAEWQTDQRWEKPDVAKRFILSRPFRAKRDDHA